MEHKSAGEDLDAAFTQATDYFEGLKEEEKPRYIIVSDYQRIRLYDLEGENGIVQEEFSLKNFQNGSGNSLSSRDMSNAHTRRKTP